MTKILTLGISALTFALHSASGIITFDLRVGGQADGKNFNGVGAGSVVPLELWAQVTNLAPVNNIFGVQSVLGAVVSSNAAGIVGTLDPMTFPSVFNATSVAGTGVELSLPPDTLRDLGSASTTATAGYAKARKDPTAAPGETIPGGTFFYATNNQPAGATVNQIANGYEFLMGTTTLRISDVQAPATPNFVLNWKIPAFTTAALRGQIASWTDGDGANNTGSGQLAEMFVGAPILVVVPEPSAFAMVMLGAMGIVGFRRIAGSRRN